MFRIRRAICTTATLILAWRSGVMRTHSSTHRIRQLLTRLITVISSNLLSQRLVTCILSEAPSQPSIIPTSLPSRRMTCTPMSGLSLRLVALKLVRALSQTSWLRTMSGKSHVLPELLAHILAARKSLRRATKGSGSPTTPGGAQAQPDLLPPAAMALEGVFGHLHVQRHLNGQWPPLTQGMVATIATSNPRIPRHTSHIPCPVKSAISFHTRDCRRRSICARRRSRSIMIAGSAFDVEAVLIALKAVFSQAFVMAMMLMERQRQTTPALTREGAPTLSPTTGIRAERRQHAR